MWPSGGGGEVSSPRWNGAVFRMDRAGIAGASIDRGPHDHGRHGSDGDVAMPLGRPVSPGAAARHMMGRCDGDSGYGCTALPHGFRPTGSSVGDDASTDGWTRQCRVADGCLDQPPGHASGTVSPARRSPAAGGAWTVSVVQPIPRPSNGPLDAFHGCHDPTPGTVASAPLVSVVGSHARMCRSHGAQTMSAPMPGTVTIEDRMDHP
jgi:hypothetical protein